MQPLYTLSLSDMELSIIVSLLHRHFPLYGSKAEQEHWKTLEGKIREAIIDPRAERPL